MNKVRLGVVSLASAVALVAGSALATMDLQKQFGTTSSDAPKAKCGTCHTKAMPKKGEGDVNAYGKDLTATKRTASTTSPRSRSSTATRTASRTSTRSRRGRTPAIPRPSRIEE